ncbi:uncharacterized protein F4817DRAFT_350102 [Daldinia loculata]|uniref:uncharacterized protein n=1 Tax=Daldinia loculata TaxID=103429 RepID=UPI0020C519B6|nr:uncharacterized protein F4817DRAFT_350102 [Daldinia loculata]KAI1643375.1 hypothetical protein F4817DRAFT_350102 [Daldinia loculata]
MKSTSVQPTRARVKGFADRIATGYYWNKEKSSYKGFPPQDCPEGEGDYQEILNELIWFEFMPKGKD